MANIIGLQQGAPRSRRRPLCGAPGGPTQAGACKYYSYLSMESTLLALRLGGARATVSLAGGPPPKLMLRGPPELATKPAAQLQTRFADGLPMLDGCTCQRAGGGPPMFSLVDYLGAPSALIAGGPNAVSSHASFYSSSSSSRRGDGLVLRSSPWTHPACLASLSSLLQQQQQQQRRGFAAASTAGKKRRKLLEQRRRNWRPPRVSQRYLREEGDAVAPKTPRLGKAGGVRHQERGPFKVEDLAAPGGPGGDEASALRFVARQKKPHEYAMESERRKKEGDSFVPQQQRLQGALLPLAETLPSLQRADFEEETERPSAAVSLGRAQGRFSVRGAYAATERDYFKRFFRDRDRALDGRREALQQIEKQQEQQQAQAMALSRRRYIPPKEYWYAGEHEPPTALTASSLGARDLKFVLMREARRIRLGGAADLSVWGALEARAAVICRDTANVSARTILRMLQAFASVQLPMQPRHVEACMEYAAAAGVALPAASGPAATAAAVAAACAADAVASATIFCLVGCLMRRAIAARQAEMRPENYVHLFQAANSLSKLGLGSHVCVTPLKLVLAVRIPTFTASASAAAKSVSHISRSSSNRRSSSNSSSRKSSCSGSSSSSSRRAVAEFWLIASQLRIAEWLQKPEVYEQLAIETQYFLEVIRNASTATFSDSSDDEEETESLPGRPPLWAVCTPRDDVAQQLQQQQQQQQRSGRRRPEAALREQMQAEAFYTPLEDTDKQHQQQQQQQQQQESEEEAPAEKQQQEQQESKASYSSALHADISRTLSLMGVDHVNAALAGPLKADIFLPGAKAVIEAVAGFQFYSNTQSLTTTSKLAAVAAVVAIVAAAVVATAAAPAVVVATAALAAAFFLAA
ncbi:hypothetical protein Emed_001289 [Eimeria media]